jgi:hypothetical protein
MKKISYIFISISCLLIPSVVGGQGTLYLSNLEQPSNGNIPVASDAWVAMPFQTGTYSGGYELNSVQLLMDAASGNPNGFDVLIYNGAPRDPGTSIGSLSGSDPLASGNYSYTASDIMLAPNTLYYVVLTATTSSSQGSYLSSLASTTTFNSSSGWLSGGGNLGSSDGLHWSPISFPSQFAIYSTEVPEPSIPAIGVLGLAVLGFSNRTCRDIATALYKKLLFACGSLGGLGLLWCRRKAISFF